MCFNGARTTITSLYGNFPRKAAGGVRTLDNALAVRAVGTVRFGATATKEILDEAAAREAEGKLREIDTKSINM